MSVFALLGRLAPHVDREVQLMINSNQEAEILKSKLEKIQEGLQDAERQGVTDLNVRRWLKDIEDVMYQMDDVLDIWETKNLELQIEQSKYEDFSDPWEKVRSVFQCLCSCFRHVVGRRELTQEMKALSERLDRILEEKGRYSFVPNKNDKSQEFKQEETISSLNESNIYGRDSDQDSLVEMLLSNGEVSGTQVISIVGIGGVGKTTLAQLAYNDPRVKHHFDLKAWVSVPYSFDALGIAKSLLENAGPSSGDASTLETFGRKDVENSSSGVSTLEALGQRIKAVVSQKKLLLVLDNVWTEDRSKWEFLMNCLGGALGCSIVVTTRSEIVVRTMVTNHLIRLSLLSDTECGIILIMIALRGRNEENVEEFCEIAFEIAKKCNGLPLAAKTIGHMLESRFTVEEWQDVLENPLWKYEDEISDLFRLLRLSYVDLPSILKRCLLSCVLNSKDSSISADDLIRIWMAQGYLSSSATWDEVQSEGMLYFQKLFMRSFFQELETNEGMLTCKMHDVMHDFANYLSRSEYYFILDGRTDETPHYLPLDTVTRIRYFCVRFVSQLELPSNLSCLLKCVRVLCLSDCDLEEISQEVGKLIHLRYLDLSGKPIKELPETVSDLYNLQTFDLRRCRNLSRLPHGIGKLIKLRHLLIRGTDHLTQVPPGLEKLTCLWTLEKFVATRDSVGYLRNLNQLRGSLEISVEGLKEAAEAEKANLRNKNHIQELSLAFCDNVTTNLVEAFLPPPQISTLFILGMGNPWLPSWINKSLDNLKILCIRDFNDCSYLPPLGELPMLEKLCIWGMKFKSLTLEFLGIANGAAVGGFPKLKALKFYACFFWEEWEDVEEAAAAAVDCVPIMPCLEVLGFYECPRLKGLPHNLLRRVTSLQELVVDDKCELLASRYDEEG